MQNGLFVRSPCCWWSFSFVWFHILTSCQILLHIHPQTHRVFLSLYPQYNFVGRILGPRGLTAKQLEAETGCKIMVRGKSSMRDKKKVSSECPVGLMCVLSPDINPTRLNPLPQVRVRHLFLPRQKPMKLAFFLHKNPSSCLCLWNKSVKLTVTAATQTSYLKQTAAALTSDAAVGSTPSGGKSRWRS